MTSTAPLLAAPPCPQACLARAPLGARPRCAMCRAPVAPDRIKPASQVDGACASRGRGFRGWVQRMTRMAPSGDMGAAQQDTQREPLAELAPAAARSVGPWQTGSEDLQALMRAHHAEETAAEGATAAAVVPE